MSEVPFYLDGDIHASWDGSAITLHDERHHQSIVLEPEALGMFMDWLHNLIQRNPEGAIFTRDVPP